MLHPETPFPNVGSYALYVDDNALRGVELVRLLERRGEHSLVTFPQRDGASGNMVVSHAALIDATPLTSAETREFHDLDRALAGRTEFRTPKQKAAKARRDALKLRIIHGPIMDRLKRFLPASQQKAA